MLQSLFANYEEAVAVSLFVIGLSMLLFQRNLLLKLIGKKSDEIPALSVLQNLLGGKEDSGLLGSILGAVLK